ncbi:hypothetical protein J5X98_07835 [Leptothermofonsia sichuanensis E412]|uniref:hypothetical protein n=1 Tax=Leptothermofonsia sichuanensis TaxID=2917832 RepID=UPI001CA64F5C|nr:hypothetical protein [Leptothermofonsia sichuanensis]QZZ22288.1 hypothetical protein J5X98_07835 [Leptothermofonsia sichuanensis E412]
MSTWAPHFNRKVDEEEQQLYDHLLSLVQSELPSQLIGRFRSLFIDGVGYPDSEISAALDRIAASKAADQEFQYVLNRCCHILINRWQTRPQLQTAIPDLIAVFESTPVRQITEYSRSRAVRRLRELVKKFVDSEQYVVLRRLAQVMAQSEASTPGGSEPLGALIRRYPYLYEHCLLSEGSSYEHQQTIKQLQTRAQRQYEIDLSQYVTYQVRRSQIAKTSSPQAANRIIQPVKNPTLLSDRELCHAIKQFAGRSQNASTYRDVARRFLTHSSQVQSFQSFKDDLYEYIVASVDPEYGRRQFNNQLYTQLRGTLPESDSQKVNDFLVVRTCSQLLNFLVVESPQKPQHYVFVDLISNLGPTLATGLLLKIVLICRKVKPYLEKRFSILFNHYESSSRDAVQWLVQAMENLNVALSTNFSTIDLSFINQIA